MNDEGKCKVIRKHFSSYIDDLILDWVEFQENTTNYDDKKIAKKFHLQTEHLSFVSFNLFFCKGPDKGLKTFCFIQQLQPIK